ncbi:efflux RND transporter periplasmic adaptor subunit [Alteromonas sp. CYL-A6]|uniref:efflux RND transporter periplasmic adaptor subunit n=1 Tax=Alteromonas nitratireducens TaxID=3390813 RepID=UPI0034C1FD23
MTNSTKALWLAVCVAAAAGFGAGLLLNNTSPTQQDSSEADEKKPLYWVAPMDPNYRRDKPGKSPMGMDLVPVYDDEQNDSAGTVRISPEVQNNLGVRTAAVTVGRLQPRVHATGYVGYNQDSLVHLHPRVAGWIEALYVDAAGDPVAAGQPLYTLYSPELVNAQKELLIARKRADNALIEAALARLKALNLPDDAIQKLRRSGEVQQNITFTSPVAGIITDLPVREGFYVQPNNNVMSLASLDTVWVEADVFARDATRVSVGQPVTMTLPFTPGNQWQGTVDYIYPTLDDATRTLRTRLVFENEAGLLKPGMYASVDIQANGGEPAILVPNDALIRTQEQTRVVVALGEGRFKSVAVKTGLSDSSVTQVTDGLMEGDEVVLSAQFLIDSESSKTSDFRRMSPMNASPEAVWVKGEVQSVDVASRVANITHDPVPEWDWPAMTMDFAVAESVDIEALASARSLHMEVAKDGDGYLISGIHVMSTRQDEPDNQATVNGEIKAIDLATRTVTIARGPIEKWNRPATTMDFIADATIDLTAFAAGDTVTFTFRVDDDFIIIAMSAEDAHSGHDMTSHGDMP